MMGNFLGVFGTIPATALLAVSFFVLVVAEKLKEGALKSFGNIVAMLLWIVSAIIFLTAAMSFGCCPMSRMIMDKCYFKEKCGKMMNVPYNDMHEHMGNKAQ